MTQPAIVVDDVTKTFRLYTERNQSLKSTLLNRGRARYEDFQALDQVSLSVDQGETFGLIGHNGSGKSTLLKCMARILRPDSGSITVEGRVSALLELGAGFHPDLSGRENIFLNASILGMPKKEVEARFDEIVAFAGLERFIDSAVKNYSSGMYVRLGFAVAVQADPEVLLIDEVLAVGDEQFQRKCNERISELRHSGATIVVVSHALGSMRSLCDRVAWFENGKLREIGETSTVIDDYLGEVAVDREGPPVEGARWGSGEAVVERIEILDATGQTTSQVATGDAIRIRLHYCADESIPRPVFGIGIHTTEGVHVTGPNSNEAQLQIEEIHGRGHVDLRIDRCMLLPGTYDISAALTDDTVLHMFDYRHRAVRFDVGLGAPHESYGGIMSLGGRWELDGDDRTARTHG